MFLFRRSSEFQPEQPAPALYKVAKKIAWGDKSLVNVHTAIGVVWDYMFAHAGEHSNDLKTIFAAASLARQRGCNAVLTGHTHTSSPFLPVEKPAGVFYGNAGGWVGRRGTAKAQTHKEWYDIDWRKERGTHKPAGEEAEYGHRSYRDQTMAELKWHKAQHFVYAQQKIIMATRDELDRIEKARRRTLEFLSRAEEKLFRTQETLKELNKTEASLEPLPLPAQPLPSLPHI